MQRIGVHRTTHAKPLQYSYMGHQTKSLSLLRTYGFATVLRNSELDYAAGFFETSVSGKFNMSCSGWKGHGRNQRNNHWRNYWKLTFQIAVQEQATDLVDDNNLDTVCMSCEQFFAIKITRA